MTESIPMSGASGIRHLSELKCVRDWELDDSGWSAQAWMSDVDLRIIDRALQRLAARQGRPLRCYEWGSGRSTLHCAQQLQQAKALGAWISVEYNREWFDRFRDEIGADVAHRVYYMDADVPPPSPQGGIHFLVYDHGQLLPMKMQFAQHRGVDMAAYVNSIGQFQEPFDFVLVDGRKRNQCLFAASQKLSERAIVFLHDAWRPYYALGATFFRTALRAGENLMVASNMPLSELLEFVDVADLCTAGTIRWTLQPGARS
jgi:hypothetical protein